MLYCSSEGAAHIETINQLLGELMSEINIIFAICNKFVPHVLLVAVIWERLTFLFTERRATGNEFDLTSIYTVHNISSDTERRQTSSKNFILLKFGAQLKSCSKSSETTVKNSVICHKKCKTPFKDHLVGVII